MRNILWQSSLFIHRPVFATHISVIGCRKPAAAPPFFSSDHSHCPIKERPYTIIPDLSATLTSRYDTTPFACLERQIRKVCIPDIHFTYNNIITALTHYPISFECSILPVSFRRLLMVFTSSAFS